MPKNNNNENNLNNRNQNQTKINFQQKKRFFGANIANNLQAEKQTNFHFQKQALLEEQREANFNSKNPKNFAATINENNLKEIANSNSNDCNQDENTKVFVFNLNHKNKNKKFFNKKSNKNEKSNSSNISAKNGSAEGSAFLGWINKQNKDNKRKNKANKATKIILSHNFNPKTSAFELVKKEEAENSFAESDKENIDARANYNFNGFGKRNKLKTKNFETKEDHDKDNENNNHKNENDKKNKLNNFPGELNGDEFVSEDNLTAFVPLSCKNNANDACEALDLIESQKARSICNRVNSNRMDIISEDNPKALRISKTIETNCKEGNLANRDGTNSKHGYEGKYINPFSLNNFNNNAACRSVNNDDAIFNANNNAFYPESESIKSDKIINDCNHNPGLRKNINNENNHQSNAGVAMNIIKKENSTINRESAFLQPQQQIKSALLNFNKNSILLNRNDNPNSTFRTGFMLNRENSVILNKNKSISNTSGFVWDATSNSLITSNNQYNNESRSDQGNERISAIQQQKINLNSSRISNSQNQMNNAANNPNAINDDTNQNLIQAQIKTKEVSMSQIANMQVEKSSEICQSAQQTSSLASNAHAGQMQTNSSNFTFNPNMRNNNNNHNDYFGNDNSSINFNNACFGNNQLLNPASFFSKNAPHAPFSNNLHNNHCNNNILPCYMQYTQLNNYTRNYNSFGHIGNNHAFNLQQNTNINSTSSLIPQNAFLAMNNAYNNCSNNGNFNNNWMLKNFTAINNSNFILNQNAGMNHMNNFALNQQIVYQNSNPFNDLNNPNKTESSTNRFQIPNQNKTNPYNLKTTNVNLLINENANSKQIIQPTHNPSSKHNLKENNRSLCIDTKVCNENFEKQIQIIQVASTTTIATTTANNFNQLNNSEINNPLNTVNINNNNIPITNQVQKLTKINQKQPLLETIFSNINRRIKVNNDQSQIPSYSTEESNLPNPFKNSIILSKLKPTPQILTEYLPEFLECLKKEENQLRYNFHLRKHHPDVTEKMRIILVSWITEVHRKFRLLDETLYLCVHIIDSCLHAKTEVTWTKANFQLLGISALLLACKYEEIYFPDISDFHIITDRAFSVSQILECEFQICKMLDYFVLTCYPIRFLELYRFMFDLNDLQFLFCKLILEIALMDSRFLEFDRSLTALAAVFVMGRSMPFDFEARAKLFYEEIGNRKAEFRECARIVCMHLDNSLQLESFRIIKERYDKSIQKIEEIYANAERNKEKHD